jgi:hypothetical protein
MYFSPNPTIGTWISNTKNDLSWRQIKRWAGDDGYSWRCVFPKSQVACSATWKLQAWTNLNTFSLRSRIRIRKKCLGPYSRKPFGSTTLLLRLSTVCKSKDLLQTAILICICSRKNLNTVPDEKKRTENVRLQSLICQMCRNTDFTCKKEKVRKFLTPYWYLISACFL